jgi:hypothetical protein
MNLEICEKGVEEGDKRKVGGRKGDARRQSAEDRYGLVTLAPWRHLRRVRHSPHDFPGTNLIDSATNYRAV